jgi:flagellar protein FliO/FliZ
MELMFGGMPDAGRFVVAFVLVLSLIGAGALLWRRFFGTGPLSPLGPRGRQPRLAVIDAAAVDARRRLILIKRDNVEHLLMIGGPTDIVVESNIGRAGPIAISREPRPIPDSASRHSTLLTDGPDWTLPPEPAARPLRASSDLDAGLVEPPARSAREAMVESMRAVRSGPVARRNADAEPDTPPDEEIAAPALTPPPSSVEANNRAPAVTEPRRATASPEAQRPPPALDPPPPYPPPQAGDGRVGGDVAEPKRAAAPTPRAVQSEEKSLAEMAQRLEAALRRPTKPIEPPAPPPAAARSPIRPESPPLRKPLLDALNASKGSVRLPELSSPPPDLKVLPGKAKAEPPPESLEDEMAKMLGRSPGKS